MIRLVNFLLILGSFIEYSKKDIDEGNTPQKVYELCSCIRETFCLSYSIRKSNNLYIYFQDKHLLLIFVGKKLRYLGPDERSQALLLIKALRKGIDINPNIVHDRIQSTPGIYCTKFLDDSLSSDYINNLIDGNLYLIIDDMEFIEKQIKTSVLDKNFEDRDLFIIPTYYILAQKSGFIEGFREMKNINFVSLSNIKPIENKILYINFRKDHLETQ